MAAAVAPSATDKLAMARLSSAPGATAIGLLRPLTVAALLHRAAG